MTCIKSVAKQEGFSSKECEHKEIYDRTTVAVNLQDIVLLSALEADMRLQWPNSWSARDLGPNGQHLTIGAITDNDAKSFLTMAASAQDVVHCLCSLEADVDGGGPVIVQLRQFEGAGRPLHLQHMQHNYLLPTIHHTHNTFSRMSRSSEMGCLL